MLELSVPYRWLFLGVVIQLLALLAVVISKLAVQEELSRREGQLLQLSKDAELAQLRQQLQPHFYSTASTPSMRWCLQVRSGPEKWFYC